MKTIEVVAAVIQMEDRILCVQRGPHKFDYISAKWEFPGGKVEAGESEPDALAREIQEELGISINVGRKLITVGHSYPDFRILMHTYHCETETSELQLTEHIDSKWLTEAELSTLDWAAADLPIVNELQRPS